MKKTIIINNEFLGTGSEDLGKIIMGLFLNKLWAEENKPDTIIFYNSGVKLMIQGSSCLSALDGLFNAGIDLIACGTCIGYYELKDKVAVGRISTMQEIVSIIMSSEKVITI
jgi:selenium metabolism protein YedF